MLPTFVFDKKGDAYLNTLRRFAFSSLVVPSQALGVAKMPAASSATQPGLSLQIPIQGPDDGSTELYSLVGVPNDVDTTITVHGIGTVSTTGTTLVTGSSTSFTTQFNVGDSILIGTAVQVVAAILSDTQLTTVVAFAVTAQSSFAIQSAANSLVQQQNIFCTIRDMAWRRQLMNRDVPAQHIFGSAQRPSFLKESLLLEFDQTLLLQFSNYNTSVVSSFQFLTEGRKWQYEALKRTNVAAYIAGLRQRKRILQPYWLTLDNGLVQVAPSTTATLFFTCTGDITLVLFNLMATGLTAAGATLDFRFKLFDAKTNRELQVGLITAHDATGTSENPFILPAPLIVEPRTQIKMQVTNPDAVNTLFLTTTFHGVAAYTGASWTGGALTEQNIVEESDRMYKADSTPTVVPASDHG